MKYSILFQIVPREKGVRYSVATSNRECNQKTFEKSINSVRYSICRLAHIQETGTSVNQNMTWIFPHTNKNISLNTWNQSYCIVWSQKRKFPSTISPSRRKKEMEKFHFRILFSFLSQSVTFAIGEDNSPPKKELSDEKNHSFAFFSTVFFAAIQRRKEKCTIPFMKMLISSKQTKIITVKWNKKKLSICLLP